VAAEDDLPRGVRDGGLQGLQAAQDDEHSGSADADRAAGLGDYRAARVQHDDVLVE
jgi:hypothetical protein